jgi:hypothetical protein
VAVISSKLGSAPGPCHPGLRLDIRTPDGTTFVEHPRFECDDSTFSKGDRLDVAVGNASHGGTLRGDLDTVAVKLRVGDLAVDLTFTRTTPLWKTTGGVSFFSPDKEKYFGWLPIYSRAEVEGTIMVDGVTANAVRGTGYHEHDFGSISMVKSIDWWLWGRMYIGDYVVTYTQVYFSMLAGFCVRWF